ncbi:MAG: hypothetical protein H0V44_10655, partial [Planctomycetes bacterium]|nr:hypothetical protein [Planctomycetota bacterium]
DSGGRPTTITTTIVNAMDRVDQYAWLYMEVAGNPPRPYASMLSPPGSSIHAATQEWVDAVRAGWLLAHEERSTSTSEPDPRGGNRNCGLGAGTIALVLIALARRRR